MTRRQRCANTSPHHPHIWGSAASPLSCPGYHPEDVKPPASKREAETERGRAKQRTADRALSTGPRCGDVRRLGGSAWECIREPHDAGHKDVDTWRRRTRGAVQADRHTYASAPHLALLEPDPAPAVP